MKHSLHFQKRFLAFFIALIMGTGTAFAAYDFSAVCSTGQTLYYNVIDATNHYVEITCPGPKNPTCWDGYTEPAGNLTLPSSVTKNGVTYTVIAIGDYAFYSCDDITGSLIIPNSVTTIGWFAFYWCDNLDGSLTIGDSVVTIGRYAFFNDRFTGALTIPNSVTEIEGYAFSSCDGFTSLTIPNSVTQIGYDAFSYCDGFTGTLTIPSSLTSISASAFQGCSGFTSLIIPSSVTEIGVEAFASCYGFTSLTIPNSVTRIRDYAFRNCDGFTGSLTIPNSVTEIGMEAFSGCDGFTGSLTIPNSVTSIGWEAFSGCDGFTGSLTIPNSVSSIPLRAFYDCSGFSSLTIGSSVTDIDTKAFYGCTGLTTIIVLPETPPTLDTDPFPEGSATIPVYVPCGTLDDYQTAEGWSSFTNIHDCDRLTYSINEDGVSVTVTGHVNGTEATGELFIPETTTINGVTYAVTAIGEEAFYDCTGLTGDLTIPHTVTTIGTAAFYGCNGFNGMLTLGNSLTSIRMYAFFYCSNFTAMTVFPETPPTLGSNTFKGVPKNIPVNVLCSSLADYQETNGWSEFTNMQCLEILTYSINDDGVSVTLTGHIYGTAATGELVIPEATTIDSATYAVTAIGDAAFRNCSGLTGSLTIPNSVTTIDNHAFFNCYGFTGLTLGNAVTDIGDNAFYGCAGLTTMTVLPETPPTLGTDVFMGVPNDIPVYVPCQSLEDYQAAEGWSAFTNMQCISELTVYEGDVTNHTIPAFITWFDGFTRSQFVIPADDLAEMTGATLWSMTFYTTNENVPYTTVSAADVYLMEVDYTEISAFEPKALATTVYSGYFSIESAGDGGEMTIHFNSPYTYHGGNLLVGVENTEKKGWKHIYYHGQTIAGASISAYNSTSLEGVTPTQQNFIPKTTFGFIPGPKSLPYIYGFEEEDEFGCWTMLDCHEQSGRVRGSNYAISGNYGFRFFYTTNPPQYLISPRLECPTEVDVSFYYKNQDGPQEWPETFQVGYSTTTKSPDAFTWGEELTAENSTWTHYKNTFPEGTKYVAIKHLSYDQNVLCLDDFSFTPVLCPTEDQCELTFELTDNYGDGWNGAAINVVDAATNIVLAALTNNNLNGITGDDTNELNTITLSMCDGLELRFEWVSGNYDDECSYVVTDSNGNVIFSGSGAMSEPVTHTVNCSSNQSQTIALAAGWNWISANVEVTLSDLENAIVNALGSSASGATIKSKSRTTTYNGSIWRGTLNSLDLTQMYKISLGASCEITLTGLPIDPAGHPVTIRSGANWIAFPLNANMSLANAFAGFAVEGDMVRSKTTSSTFNGSSWRGTLKNLEPGKGYVYKSAVSGNRTFTFPTGAK